MYKRILVKLSGEAIGQDDGRGIESSKLERVANQLVKLNKDGVEIAVVIGAGNFWRGKYGGTYIKRTTSDYMGMLATTLNALALQEMLESKGIETRVQTAIEMKQVAEPYIRRKAIRHLEKGRVVIFGGGTGNPYFSTDTTAALRAAEINADVILMAKNGVDGVYSADPKVDPSATKYDELTQLDLIAKNLKVMDRTASSLSMDTHIPLIVFNVNTEGNIKKVVMGENIGTVIEGGKNE